MSETSRYWDDLAAFMLDYVSRHLRIDRDTVKSEWYRWIYNRKNPVVDEAPTSFGDTPESVRALADSHSLTGCIAALERYASLLEAPQRTVIEPCSIHPGSHPFPEFNSHDKWRVVCPGCCKVIGPWNCVSPAAAIDAHNAKARAERLAAVNTAYCKPSPPAVDLPARLREIARELREDLWGTRSIGDPERYGNRQGCYRAIERLASDLEAARKAKP